MSRARGFTLVEVLAALVIVALGMAALMMTLGSSASTVAYLREKTLAQWIALNQIATVRLSGVMPKVGTSDGKIDYAGRRWRWHERISDAGVPDLYRIRVSVQPAGAPQGKGADSIASATGVIASNNLLAPPQAESLFQEYAAPSGGVAPSGGP